MNEEQYKQRLQWLRLAVMFLIVVALGTLAVNQSLGYLYKAQFLKSPCSLCAELNPDVKDCLTSTTAVYWNKNNNYSWQPSLTNITVNFTSSLKP